MPRGLNCRFWQTDRRKCLSVCSRLNVAPVSNLLLLAFFSLLTVASATGLERPKYRTVYACEGATLNMECEPDHVINLIRANYGRFSITICNEHGNTEWSVNCMSLRSHRVLHDRCSQRQNCSIAASTRGFGDPCPGTLKYLEAHFQCVPVNPPSHTARPRPPWFLATKTTASSMTEDRVFPNHDPHFHRDIATEGRGNEERDGGNEHPFKTILSTTSPTLRPPPWLITNATRNATTTTSTPVSTSITPPTTPSTTSSTTTTTKATRQFMEQPDSDNEKRPSYEEVSREEFLMGEKSGSKNPQHKNVDQQKGSAPTSTPVSTTTLWVPQAEAPGRGFGDEISWCGPSTGRGLFWNWTRGGEVAVQPCPGGASGWATRPCDPQGWMVPPDLGECRSVWLTTLQSRAEANDAVLSVAHDLTIVTESRPLYGGDVTATARLLNGLTERMAGDVSNFPDEAQREALVTELVIKTLATGSNLLGKQHAAWGDLRTAEHRTAVTELLLGLEEAAFLLADNLYHEKTITHSVLKILMRIQVVETRNVSPVTFPNGDDPWPVIDDPPQVGGSNDPSYDSPPNRNPPRYLQDYITLPPEAMLENSENGLVKMVFFSYDGLQDLLQPQKSYGYVKGTFQTLNRTRIVNSRVVSASLGAGRHIELSEPVLITFKMIKTVNVTNPSCVFWDYTTSSWSDEGCRVLYYNTTHTRCQCEHLTNFAVLMDVHATQISAPHQMALSVITYVGCVISIVCLLLATIFFHAFRGLQNDRTTIHKNLCICLLIAEIIFMGGIMRTEQPLVCSIIAGFLHYFFLAAFAWMLLEGFQLYVMLVEVFEAEKSRVRWYYATAYGVPALIVAVSAVIDPYSYGTPDICWLRTDNYFIFAFVGPVLLVLVANSVFLTLSLILMCRHAQNSAALKNKEHTRLASLRSWTRGAIILMFLLGLTWTFGLLYLNQASVGMAYVFTVLNSLQGLFIFVFHCIQNDKVKREFRRASRRHEWLHSCLCYSHSSRSTSSTSIKTDARNSQLSPTTLTPSQASNFLVAGLSTSTWRQSNVKNNGEGPSPGPSRCRPQYGATLPSDRPYAGRQPPGVTGTVVSRHCHSTLRNQHTYEDDEKYSFKSCGRDSGHGGSEQEESPRTCPPPKLGSIRLNNNMSHPQQANEGPRLVNPFTAAAALEHGSGTRMPNNLIRGPIRNQSPWNHTYTEIGDGGIIRHLETGPDPVYEEIEREVRSEVQVSDLSDEDSRRQSSDVSRQSSRSYGDHRPLLPYTLPDHNLSQSVSNADPRFQARLHHPGALQLAVTDPHHFPPNRIVRQAPYDHTIVSAGHVMPLSHPSMHTAESPPLNGHIGVMGDINHYTEMLTALRQAPVVQPLSEPNLRSWEAVQRHKDLQQLQHLGEMTVAVLNGEQVVCKLKSPLAPIHESSSQTTTTVGQGGPGVSTDSEQYFVQKTYSHC